MSPLFWVLIFDSLLDSINDGGPVMATGYADDAALQIKGHDLPTLFCKMQIALDKAQVWADQFGLNFCKDKTHYMIFGGNPKTNCKLTLGAFPVNRAETTKYLGVIPC